MLAILNFFVKKDTKTVYKKEKTITMRGLLSQDVYRPTCMTERGREGERGRGRGRVGKERGEEGRRRGRGRREEGGERVGRERVREHLIGVEKYKTCR